MAIIIEYSEPFLNWTREGLKSLNYRTRKEGSHIKSPCPIDIMIKLYMMKKKELTHNEDCVKLTKDSNERLIMTRNCYKIDISIKKPKISRKSPKTIPWRLKIQKGVVDEKMAMVTQRGYEKRK